MADDDEQTNYNRDHDALVDLRARFEEFRLNLDNRLLTAAQVLEGRLEKLNELREQVSEDRTAYVRTDTFQASVREVRLMTEAVKKELDVRLEEMNKTVERMQNWQSKWVGVSAALIAVSGIVGIFIGYVVK
jgi:hypothetical protein